MKLRKGPPALLFKLWTCLVISGSLWKEYLNLTILKGRFCSSYSGSFTNEFSVSVLSKPVRLHLHGHINSRILMYNSFLFFCLPSSSCWLWAASSAPTARVRCGIGGSGGRLSRRTPTAQEAGSASIVTSWWPLRWHLPRTSWKHIGLGRKSAPALLCD